MTRHLLSIPAREKSSIEGSPKSKTLIRPFIPAGEIVRYGIPSHTRFIIFIPQGWTTALAGNKAGWRWFRKKFPAIAWHLKPYEERAKARKHQGDFWWECAVEQGAFDQAQSRIIFSSSGNIPAFIFDAGASIPDRHTQFMNSSSFYLLAILNSRLSKVRFRRYCTRKFRKKSNAGVGADCSNSDLYSRFG